MTDKINTVLVLALTRWHFEDLIEAKILDCTGPTTVVYRKPGQVTINGVKFLHVQNPQRLRGLRWKSVERVAGWELLPNASEMNDMIRIMERIFK